MRRNPSNKVLLALADDPGSKCQQSSERHQTPVDETHLDAEPTHFGQS
jgi:hypothetical protein